MHFRILKMIGTSGFLTVLRVHQIRFRPGFVPNPLAGLRGPIFVKGGKGEGNGEKRKGRGLMGGKETRNSPLSIHAYTLA